MAMSKSSKPAHHLPKLVMIALTATTLVAALAAGGARPAQAHMAFSDPAFERVWERSDKPVQERVAVRTWMWGPEATYTAYEPYAEGPAGQHLVTYLDKSRMEINNPAGDRNAQWFVTNGLLVVDMVAGHIQTGNNSFAPAQPANIPVAGDANSPEAPTYAALAKVASLNGANRAPVRTGQAVIEGLGRTGNVGIVGSLSGYARYASYEATLGHNIPDVFWSFLNARGTVYENGGYAEGMVVDWLFAMGYPITEPYWINIKVDGKDRWVLMQAFQRRILTYSPQNADGWKVEMGNVGQAYFDWRYKGLGVQPPPTVAPTTVPVKQASITINPASGDTSTGITVSGKDFPSRASVAISIENVAAKYSRTVANVTADANGSFTTKVTVPGDASTFGRVTVAAMANDGKVRATQVFQLSYDPSITAGPANVMSGGMVSVQGQGFPARQDVKVGLVFGNQTEWKATLKADDSGRFSTTVALGTRTVGTTFYAIATANGGLKAVSARITVIAAPPPAIAVNPNGLAVGQTALVMGSNWPANTDVRIGLVRGGQTAVEEWVATARSNTSGSFSVTFILSNRWLNAGQISIKAVVNNGPRASVPMWVLATGARVIPAGLPMTVYTAWYKDGPTQIKVKAEGWQAGKVFNLYVISGDGSINAPVGSATVRADGTLQASITPAQPWWGRRDLGIRVTTADGQLFSVRYLPATDLTRTTGSTYVATGANWPAGARVEVVLHIDGQPDRSYGATNVDNLGAFDMSVTLPKIPDGNKNDIEIRTLDGGYSAIFDF